MTLVYRRTRAQMPADPAEVDDCIEEGIGLRDLLAPASVVADGGRVAGLACTRMTPGRARRLRPAPAGAGARAARRSSPPTPSSRPSARSRCWTSWPGSQLAAQAGRHPGGRTPPPGRPACPGLFAGGDVVHGPASVIQAIADGRAAAEAIARRHGVAIRGRAAAGQGQRRPRACMEKKARLRPAQKVPVLPLTERAGFNEVISTFTPEAAAVEAGRCLDCDDLCSLCVTVCPNRANHAYPMAPFRLDLPRAGAARRPAGAGRHPAVRGGADRADPQHRRLLQRMRQLHHLLPHRRRALPGQAALLDRPRRASGRPRATPSAWSAPGTAWSSRPAWAARPHRLEVGAAGDPVPRRPGQRPLPAPDPGSSWAGRPRAPWPKGHQVDFAPCATLLVLLNAEPVIPDLVRSDQ